MRLWSLHPRFLDAKGIVALWREGLLARAVLRGQTRGYRHHPQLQRFRQQTAPVSTINAYLKVVADEAAERGYCFDRSKLGPARGVTPVACSRGQLDHEWRHLLAKLQQRDPARYRELRTQLPQPHPLFRIVEGPIESWERP
ncbi:DNA lyase [Pseudoxanthomonas kalamensis DSM 18571]|uniref:pyrimidine dimer DNA glycosylase/endonuclease V n=1 Tax=Pseudoxanthomonas kalamensis TaxID=289483 RepID=UPI00139181B8|nr:pyrimidine dimer DNA glycosylase/endonuclease V [Pseudoxanthomonas kalamensis]KAF1710503.1 DNA lyase [Pseudoxanthomonas kalamensis DSM 18571]